MLELYETLLGAVVAQPELKLEQLVALLAKAENVSEVTIRAYIEAQKGK